MRLRQPKFGFAAIKANDSLRLLSKNNQPERVEQLRELADIFASIFEALHDGHDDAIATTRRAA